MSPLTQIFILLLLARCIKQSRFALSINSSLPLFPLNRVMERKASEMFKILLSYRITYILDLNNF